MFRLTLAFLFFTFFTFTATAATEPSSSPDLNINAIQTLTKLKGQFSDRDNTFKITAPRDDLTVTVNGVNLTSSMGLTSWVTFKKISGLTVSKGELVLTDTQVEPVMGVALKNHIAVTALHNHFLWDSPKIMFMRIEAVGNEENLGKALGNVFAKIEETSKGNGEFPVATIDTSSTTLNPTQVNNIIRAKGYGKNGIYHIAVGGTKINARAIFAGSDNAAVVDGDFVVHEADLQNVLWELHKGKIQVVSIHQQIANDGQSPVVALHFWGIGNAKSLAKGIRFGMNAARLYSKDQMLTATNKPTPSSYPTKVVSTIQQKIVTAAQELKPQQTQSQSTPLTKIAVIKVPTPVVQPLPHLPKQDRVKQVIEKMRFGTSKQIGYSKPSFQNSSHKTTVSQAKPTHFNPKLLKNVMDKIVFGG